MILRLSTAPPEPTLLAKMIPHPLHFRLTSLLLTLAVLGCIFILPLRASTNDYSAIESAIQQGRLAWAEQELENRLSAEPQDFQAHMLLGIVLDELNHRDDAAQHLKEAVRLRPKSAAAHINLGKHDARTGDLAGAITEFETAVRLSPNDPAAHNNLGLALMSQGKPKLALPEFQKAANAEPRDPGTWFNLFKCQLALKHFPEARMAARRISSLAPPSAELLNQLGALQAEAGDNSGAIETLTHSLALNPGYDEARYNLGLAYYHGGNLTAAIATLESLRKDRDSAELDNLRGEIYEHKQNYLMAVQAFQAAAEAEPTNEEYRFDFVSELLDHRNADAAIEVAQPAVRDFPQSMRLQLALGAAYFAKGLYDEADSDFLATARQFTDSEQPLYFLGLAVEASHRGIPEARELIQSYGDRHLNQYWPFYFLGHLALLDAREDQSPEALRAAANLLQKSVELRTDFPEAHLDLGNAYSRLNRWPEAIAEYRKATSLKADLSEAHFKLYQAYQHVGDETRAKEQLAIHERLRQRKDQQTLDNLEVKTFLYQLRKN